MRQTRDNAPHQNVLLVRELITNKEKILCGIGMERPYGTVCEHVRRGVPTAHHYLSISFVSLPSHWMEGWKEQDCFFYARAI